MRTEGLAGLFRGLGPTIVTNAPYSAFYYLFYTSLQQRMQQVERCLMAPLFNDTLHGEYLFGTCVSPSHC